MTNITDLFEKGKKDFNFVLKHKKAEVVGGTIGGIVIPILLLPLGINALTVVVSLSAGAAGAVIGETVVEMVKGNNSQRISVTQEN